jgi:branched-chain amino acid aminotransferase
MASTVCYVNGEYLPYERASLPIGDLGIVRGYGVFDLFRTYGGVPFRMREHLDRLKRSADSLGLGMPCGLEELEALVWQTLARNNLPEAVVRVVVTGGPSADSLVPEGHPSLAILVRPPPNYPKSYYEEGASVVTVPMERFMPATKSLSYIPAVLANRRAREAGAVEAVYINRGGEPTEGTTTNLFVFEGDRLVTPREGILLGITREVVLEAARGSFKVEEKPVSPEGWERAEEIFLCGTTKEIMPVVRVDGRTIGTGRPGSRTRLLMDRFSIYVGSLVR